MILAIISLIDSCCYYICMLSIGINILNSQPKKRLIYVSFILFIPIIIVEILCYNYFLLINSLVQIMLVLLVRLCLKEVRFLSIVSSYMLLFLINTTITSCLISIFSINSNLECLIEISVNLFSSIICLIVCNTKLNKKIQQMLNLTQRSVKRLLLSLICFGTILVVLISNETFFKNSQNWFSATKISLIIFIILLSSAIPILIIYSMTNTHIKKLVESYEEQINAQSEHYALLSESNYELRKFRHDYNNMYIGLRKLISVGETETALEMLNNDTLQLIDSTIKYDTGNGIVDALLTDKQKKANKFNTKIIFQGAIPSTGIKPTDLCIIFGNTIDNSIEACEKLSLNVAKTISIDCVCNSGFMFIKIINPIEKEVKIHGNIPTTTKKDKKMHGFGLYSLNRVVNQHNGKMEFKSNTEKFQIDIEMCINC